MENKLELIFPVFYYTAIKRSEWLTYIYKSKS